MKNKQIEQRLKAWAVKEFEDACEITVAKTAFGLWDVTIDWDSEGGMVEIYTYKVDGEKFRFCGVTEVNFYG